MKTEISRRIGMASLAGLMMCAGMSALAANNPLDTIAADQFSAKSPGVKIATGANGSANLAGMRDGDYVKYEKFDFDSGVAAFKAHVATTKSGTIEIRLDAMDGPVMGKCDFKATGGWDAWQDVTCNLDNAQSGVRDFYLIVRGDKNGGALLNLRRFVFLKSVVVAGQSVDLSSRLDVEDGEPQATKAWGIPENGFQDDFQAGSKNWNVRGMELSGAGAAGKPALIHRGAGMGFAYTPGVYINKTDIGGEWRTMAEASLAADIILDSKDAVAGVGFASKDGKQWVYVTIGTGNRPMEVRRKLLDGSDTLISRHPRRQNEPGSVWNIEIGVKYRLKVAWSPYSNGLIAFVHDGKGEVVTSFRTAIDLPAARRPLLLSPGGDVRFERVAFDPTLDGWNFKWEWRKTPILSKDVCNPAVWKGNDGKFYMMWRKFGTDNYHGIVSSTDAIHWTRVNDEVLKTTGDMNIVMNPFGDGLDYITGGSANANWWTSDGSLNYTVWKKSNRNVGAIAGACRVQEIIDTKLYPQIGPIKHEGQEYRFIGYTEDWNRMPKPHTVVLLSNTLTNWVLASKSPVIPPSDHFWGEKGNAIGSAMVLPDGNILLANCSCTRDGYTGASEPTNVSAIADGKEPWKLLKTAILPDAPVSRESVWYRGPNFGTAYLYDKDSDTLYFYGGFHDYEIGMMRVRNFSRYFTKKP